MLRIGVDDLSDMLQEVATKFPDQAGVISECALIANKRNLELLAKSRRVQDSGRSRAEALVEKLELIEEFVSNKYFEAPAGEDERELAVKERVEEIIGDLRSLT